MAQTSKSITTDGTKRLAELRRDDDGTYEFSVFGSPLDGTMRKDVTADLTQSIYQAMRREMVLNSPLYQKALRAAQAELKEQMAEKAEQELSARLTDPLIRQQIEGGR